MRVFFQLLVLLISSTSLAQQYRYESSIDHDDQINIDLFKNNIEVSGANTVDEALGLIPSEFFENYVLVYRSRSLQDSSFEYPRAIVFGKSARFIMSFNGHESQKGYNSIEAIQFREDEQKWEFHEITFSETTPPKFEKNPTKCLECHQSPSRQNVDMRPNWEPYNFWPGVYASMDKTLEPVLRRTLDRANETGSTPYGVLAKFTEDDFILVDEQSQEKERLEFFEENIKTAPLSRYRFLGEFNTRDPLDFTKALIQLNMMRISRIMKESLGEAFDTYKYTLFGMGTASFLSSRNLRFQCRKLYMTGEPLNTHLNFLNANYAINLENYLNPPDTYFEKSLEEFLDIIFQPFGVSTKDWSMDFKTNGRFAFRNRYGSPADSFIHLRDAMVRVYKDEPAAEMSCDELEEKSEQALQQFYGSGEMMNLFNAVAGAPIPRQRPLIDRCMNCHVGYDDVLAPYIPFNNPMLLKVELDRGTYRRGTLLDEIRYRTGPHATRNEQMPPAGQVDPELRQEFLDFIESL